MGSPATLPYAISLVECEKLETKKETVIKCNFNRLQFGKICNEKQNRNIKNSHYLSRESWIEKRK